ncbi:hypothetical protein MBLNU230_g5328t1 [Neophaeotheca triangularis]
MDVATLGNNSGFGLANSRAPFASRGSGTNRQESAARLQQTNNMASQQHNPSPLLHSRNNTSSNYSMQSQPSSRSSDTTQGTAHSTLFPPPLPTNTPGVPQGNGAGGNNGDVTATDNIMNSVGDAKRSLFQICVTLRLRLSGVSGFEESVVEEEQEADEELDPVSLLWRTFRKGHPLILLFNTLKPDAPIQAPNNGVKRDKMGKASSFKFVQACMDKLKFEADDCFIMQDLYGDDTTGFVKVVRVVARVLDLLIQDNLIEDMRQSAPDAANADKSLKRTQQQHIINELVTTERTYVQHLELLQRFKELVVQNSVIPGDAIHDIFHNLDQILNFQRRFLIRVEQINELKDKDQNWGKLFVNWMANFQVYEPYIANQKRCQRTVDAEFNKLKTAGGSNEMRQMVENNASLYGFLMKPFQRLSKYPLLLGDLIKKGDMDAEKTADLEAGKAAATHVLSLTNEAVGREERVLAVEDLKSRVEDWKGHRVEQFGDLMLYGTFTVVKSEAIATGKDAERQYHVYLFETILLCCKDIDPSKPKNKLASKPMVDKRGKPKLQLKGRIFMQNVTDLISLSKSGTAQLYLKICTNQTIFWKGDPSIENFIIKFNTDNDLKTWSAAISEQRRIHQQQQQQQQHADRYSHGSRHGAGTSATEFTFLHQNKAALPNPYQDQQDDEDDDEAETLVGSTAPSVTSGYPGREHSYQSRNGSNSSLRSRSTTTDSNSTLASTGGRGQTPRFPAGGLPQQAPLTLRTRELQQQAASPGDRGGDSYFSPTVDSPMSSSRISSSSGAQYPFPPQQYPPGGPQNGYYQDSHGHTRYTAPAMNRPPMDRRGDTTPSSVSNGYAPPGRNGPAPRPGYPNSSGLHSAQNMPQQARNRSASSPDIHNSQRRQQQGANAGAPGGAPPVPDVPLPYQNAQAAVHNPGTAHLISRSQSNSPNLPQQPNPPRHQPSRDSSRSYTRQPSDPYDRTAQPTPITSSRSVTPSSNTSVRTAFSPPPALPYDTDGPPPQQTTPTQLRVKVNVADNKIPQILTLVVPISISYQSLKDRIEAKLQRSAPSCTLSFGSNNGGAGQAKLKYYDEGDYVSIQSDEDVVSAFESWSAGVGEGAGAGGMGEIELFCQR